MLRLQKDLMIFSVVKFLTISELFIDLLVFCTYLRLSLTLNTQYVLWFLFNFSNTVIPRNNMREGGKNLTLRWKPSYSEVREVKASRITFSDSWRHSHNELKLDLRHEVSTLSAFNWSALIWVLQLRSVRHYQGRSNKGRSNKGRPNEGRLNFSADRSFET